MQRTKSTLIISRSQSAYISPANQVQSCVVGTLEDWIVIYLLGEADTQAILCQVETWTHGTRLAPENNIVLNIQYFAALPKLRLLSDDSDVGAKISNKTIRNVGSYMINMSLAETLEERKVNIGSETNSPAYSFIMWQSQEPSSKSASRSARMRISPDF